MGLNSLEFRKKKVKIKIGRLRNYLHKGIHEVTTVLYVNNIRVAGCGCATVVFGYISFWLLSSVCPS